jgi:isoquinoline 1-oxidoreductase beta subunit
MKGHDQMDHMDQTTREPVSNKRRQLLKAGAAAGGGLLFGFSLFGCARQGETPSGDLKEPPP